VSRAYTLFEDNTVIRRLEVLLPLLPLTKGGNTPQAVEEMISELVARDRSDLLELGLFCAGLVLKDESHTLFRLQSAPMEQEVWQCLTSKHHREENYEHFHFS
jgi:hypothetical protein